MSGRAFDERGRPVDNGDGRSRPTPPSRRASDASCGCTAKRCDHDGRADGAELADWPKNAPRLVYVRAGAEREATFAVDRIQEYVEWVTKPRRSLRIPHATSEVMIADPVLRRRGRRRQKSPVDRA